MTGESMGRGAMTLVEVMVVVVVIGILARLIIPNYFRVVEKGRSAEARTILGVIRQAEDSYYIAQDSYGTFNDLNLTYPVNCDSRYYFSFSFSSTAGADGRLVGYVATANRCTSGGKPPQGPAGGYALNITEAGVLGGTPIYL